MPAEVRLVVTKPLDGRKWTWTMDRLERLARAERPAETGDAVAAMGGTVVALGAVAVGILALMEAGVISLPQEVRSKLAELAGLTESREKGKP